VSRALFIYWKLPVDQLPAARAAVRAFQADWRSREPVLQAALFERADAQTGAETGPATLMETYAMPAGLPPATEAALRAESTQTLGHWALSGRHVEVFVRDRGA
jgi:Domain of unknown function (DUF4936)